MAKAKKKSLSPNLTADKRRQLPKSSFALPGKDKDVPGAKGTYPIDTPGRARAAVSRATQNATPAQQTTIKKRAAAKYPEILFAAKKSKSSKKK